MWAVSYTHLDVYKRQIPCKGYFVCQMEALYRLDTAPVKPERIVEPEPNTYRYDFTPNGIDLKHFPLSLIHIYHLILCGSVHSPSYL